MGGTPMSSAAYRSSTLLRKSMLPANKFRVGDLERQLWKKLREKKVEMIEQLSLDLYAA